MHLIGKNNGNNIKENDNIGGKSEQSSGRREGVRDMNLHLKTKTKLKMKKQNPIKLDPPLPLPMQVNIWERGNHY